MNDLVSRQDVFNEIKKVSGYLDKDMIIGLYIGVNMLPSAQPERKKGKWVRITQGATPEQYICPFCHRTVEAYGVEELLSIRYPYCHCGADMRGEAV